MIRKAISAYWSANIFIAGVGVGFFAGCITSAAIIIGWSPFK